jgi:deoxyribodipyrimidine photo-lyase
VDVFLSELGWRDYAQNQIVTMPDYGARPANPISKLPMARCPGRPEGMAAGPHRLPHRGCGDAQLWLTGWMHNRVRMIVASLLIKHLGIDWRVGEQWFWDTLVDADYAQNAVNWQWSAGSGVDANQFTDHGPAHAKSKFDAAAYIRQWVPELADLDEDEIHDPSPLDAPPRAIRR